jgi:hypothetical protein
VAPLAGQGAQHRPASTSISPVEQGRTWQPGTPVGLEPSPGKGSEVTPRPPGQPQSVSEKLGRTDQNDDAEETEQHQ